MPKRKIAYYFRGTTLGYEGSYSNQALPITPTTVNPAKAAVFSTLCESYGSAVIFIAKAGSMKAVSKQKKNFMAKPEEEVTFSILPAQFPLYCEGYITLAEAKRILRKLKVPVIVKDYTTEGLEEMGTLPADVIEQFYELAAPLLKIT
jgi:hypothetical protein